MAPPLDPEAAREAFRARGLLRDGELSPDYDRGSVVSVGPTVARSLDLSLRADRALDLRERAGHAVLLLADSLSVPMALRLLREVPGLRERTVHASVLTSTFPSVTPTSISSLLSGLYPGEHGIPGFHFRVRPATQPRLESERERRGPNAGRVIHFYRLSPAEVEEEGELRRLGYDLERFRLDSLFAEARRSGLPARLVMPAKIAPSLSTDLLRSDAPVLAYRKGAECFRPLPPGSAGLTYLYYSAIDESLHLRGLHHRTTEAAFRGLAHGLDEWLREWKEEGLLFLTSDHGHVDLRQPRVVDLHDPALGKLLDLPPAVSGGRVTYFYTSRVEETEVRLRALAGDDLRLLRREEVVERGLLGPAPVTEEARGRIGDLTAVARGSAYMRYRYSPKTPVRPDGATHSALAPEEMMVPLIVAWAGKR